MVDFLMITTRPSKRGVIEIYPKFIIKDSSDLMIRGGDFYAIWLEDRGLWSTKEQDALQLIDRELDKYAEENRHTFDANVKVLHMWDAESGMIDSWHKYCQKQMRDWFCMLDEKLVFSNTQTNKKDYASKKLNYPLEAGNLEAYNRLMSTLYSEEERHKIEWAIGSIVSGESKRLQKFMVLYGATGTGKSTVLNIVQQLFEGYYSVFDAKALGSSNNSFALEAFKSNPLVAIQHDGDLSHIEDNTRLNSLVSHEMMTVNEKFKSAYANRFKCFLFMGTNKPVKITDAKSGLIRRLIDVSPSGNKLDTKEYRAIVKQIGFNLGAVAYHCQEVYLNDPNYYDDYIPMNMLGASNDFYNFMLDSYYLFKKEDGTTLKVAWEMYKTYCDEAKVSFPFSQRIFKEELKNYFRDYKERIGMEDGSRVRSYYEGFRTDRFEPALIEKKPENAKTKAIKFGEYSSIFDAEFADCPAQYATSKETPSKKWINVTTKLRDLDTSKLHYVQVPENHIVIDFDLRDEFGNKSLEKNIEVASKWPTTYAELSKGGEGIHLHYFYKGDANMLSSIYDENIEIKIPVGNAALRRKLTQCNEVRIATISSGLPLKGESKLVDFGVVKSEKSIRVRIKRNLNKEIHPGTKPSIDFIYKILEDAYTEGIIYDVTDMRNAVLSFAANSTHHSEYCIKLVNKMKFQSEKISPGVKNDQAPLAFFDVEIFPNLFLICWKVEGEGKPVIRMFNPSPTEIEKLSRFRLVGFNCRRYDNHVIYAGMLGYTVKQLFELSQKIIKGSENCFFGEAYNLSYTDVYDFSNLKQSLKKFEIDLNIHHQELGLEWDKPVPEERWEEVGDYCANDVIATEATFNARKADFIARQILADLAGGTVNDTTNSLTAKIIFGNNRKPQSQFHYRNLGMPCNDSEVLVNHGQDYIDFIKNNTTIDYGNFIAWDGTKSALPYFPGYVYDAGKSTYRGKEVGEGGYVAAEPWMYGDVALLDVVSMHPWSAITEVLFGAVYTAIFKEIVDTRVCIKYKDFKRIMGMLNGAVAKYLDNEERAEELAYGLKIPINSMYGLTAASFENPFRDIRNKDNIVAKRGALFMIDLQYAVQEKGFTVAHIKTDSIKIPNATPEIISFVMDFGKKYGYTFDHEATYDKMCLVNDAVYVAKYASKEKCEKMYGYIPGKNKKYPGEWTATGTEFQVPYVFKRLFSNEEIKFEDKCETKSVSSSLYLDMNENLGENEHNYRFIGRVGQFCPIKKGHGGGILYREKDGKYNAASGSKGYRWLESEVVRQLGRESDIDLAYYEKMVEDAALSISKYGDVDWFVSEKEYTFHDNEICPF